MSSSFCVAILTLFITLTFGHSQMRCANYDKASGTCSAPIRDWVVAYQAEDNEITNGGAVCQAPWISPISAYYNNGKNCEEYAGCPGAMGSIQQGSNFTITWVARNHAVPDQTPGNIVLYMSPVEDSSQNVETNTAVFFQNQICQAPFISCDGKSGDLDLCYATCKMPASTQVGIHTLLWYWKWVQQDHTSIYTTCADIYVTAGSGSNVPSSSSPSSTSSSAPSVAASPITTAAATRPSSPSTTGSRPSVKPSTTAAASRPSSPSTTGSKPSVKPITTSSMPSIITPAPATPSPSSNCAAVSTVSSSIASLASVDVWGTGYHALITINVKEAILSNWVLEVKLPNQSPAKITSFFNAGLLQCEENNTAYFVPVAHWANDLTAGSTVSVEFIATNNGMDANTITSNMQVRVLQR